MEAPTEHALLSMTRGHSLVELPVVNEGSVLHVLRDRFERDEIYTKVGGDILISINPFKVVSGMYGEDVMLRYVWGVWRDRCKRMRGRTREQRRKRVERLGDRWVGRHSSHASPPPHQPPHPYPIPTPPLSHRYRQSRNLVTADMPAPHVFAVAEKAYYGAALEGTDQR